MHWQARRQPGQAPGRAGLLARLAHAAADHVIDLAGVQRGIAAHQLLQHLREQIDRVQLGQRAVGFGPCHGAADGINDDWNVHLINET
ncbi:hypothetical protein D3C72_1593940 [compost metagenome]